MIIDFEKLSKEISYALRHSPWKYDLEVNENGWVNIDQLLISLKKNQNWKDLTIDDIKSMIESSNKKRHEIFNNKIRALYGHSFSNKIEMKEKIPPRFLYHGTTRRFLNKIKDKGLLPIKRQYVHLSSDIETAQTVGKRRDSNPIILKILSLKAYREGQKFYHANDKIWLSKKIDNNYICELI